MQPRTVGVEEELLLIDPRTRAVTSRAREVLKENAERGHGAAPRVASDELDQELFRHQLEIRTDPSRDIADIERQLAAGRRTAREAAAARELAVAVCATIPLGEVEPVVSPNDRYRAMVEAYGEIARYGTTCGMHVHVAVTSPEEGVAVIDRISPWLPVLLALSANSPYSEGRDTGYASWRSQLWSRWPSAGPTEAFGSLEGYRGACRRLIATGAARDPGMLYFDARLSEVHPTVEVRVLDAVTDVADAGILAALVRGLVETASDEAARDEPRIDWRSEELRAARWVASRNGLVGRLVDPGAHELRPAAEVVDALVELVGDRLESADDLDRVTTGLARLRSGTGATRQRAVFERTGSLEAVVDDLVERSAAFAPSPGGTECS